MDKDTLVFFAVLAGIGLALHAVGLLCGTLYGPTRDRVRRGVAGGAILLVLATALVAAIGSTTADRHGFPTIHPGQRRAPASDS